MSEGGPSSTYAPWQFSEYTIAFEGNSIGCILYGIYLVIAGANLYLLRNKRYRALLLYTIVQLVLTTLYFVISLYSAPSQSLGIFNIAGSSGPDALSPWPSVVVDVTFVVNTWISDAFLLYRCYVVCMGNRYALGLPVLLYIATIGSSTAWLVVSSMPGADYSTHTVQLAGTVYWSCSVAMNVCASSLISMRLWMHRQAISMAAGSQQGAFYLGYMAMTLESALLYTVFAIVALIMFTLNSPLENVFFPVLGTIQAIAPSLIIYRIARGISFETDEFGSMEVGSIQFASSERTRAISPRIRQDVSNGSSTLQTSACESDRTYQGNSSMSLNEIKPQV